MKYARFEDLPVWQAASDLALRTFALGEKLPLRGWAQHLQGSPIRGQRYLTAKTRQADQARRDRDEFLKELDAMSKKP